MSQADASLIRLYDLALNGYEQGRQSLLEVGQPAPGLRFGLFISAPGHFEVCIDTLKRAINHIKTLRAAQFVAQSLKHLIPRGTPLLSGIAEGQISDMRHALKHLEERIAKGEIGQDESFVLYPTEDGIAVGTLKIVYEDLAKWINELAEMCERVAQYHE